MTDPMPTIENILGFPRERVVTGRINHSEVAIDALESIELVTAEVYGQAPDQRELRLRIAEVHATLAVAEQQRIANVIAVQQHEEQQNNSGFAADLWNDVILEGLGLT